MSEEMKNGKMITFSNRAQVRLVSESLVRGFDSMYEGDTLILNYSDRKISLSGTYDKSNPRLVNGDPIGVFFEEVYTYLKNSGDVCIDVGASIGDSSIWLALNGFSRIIALEPYPQNFKHLRANMDKNGLNDTIECINKAVAFKNGAVKIDEKAYVDGGFDLHEVKEGVEIHTIPLEDIIKSVKGKKLCLKMDCEGCEYDSILKADCQTLTSFTKIVIEYHYGYNSIEAKLQECGFTVTHTGPHKHNNPNAQNKKMLIGYIYAEQV